jgi:serine/threonine protein kinase
MELCDTDLKRYINGERVIIGDETMAHTRNNLAYVAQDCSTELKLRNIWMIMTQIARGVKFIHGVGHAHRDLKPANSKLSI